MLGKVFRTLRVESWKAAAGQGAKKEAGRRGGEAKPKRQEGEGDKGARKPGQVYLVLNAWMKAARPYD